MSCPSATAPAQQGFTLIEVLVAITIFGLMAAMAYGGLNALIRDKTHLEASQQRLTAVQKAVFRLQMDFQNLQDRPVRDSFGRELPALLYTADGGLAFTTGGLRNPLQLPRSSMQRIAYRVEAEKDSNSYRLLRLRWSALDRSGDDVPDFSQVLLDDVEKVEWRFLSGTDDWHTAWPDDANTLFASGVAAAPSGTAGPGNTASKLPRAVELRLTMPEYGELRFVFQVLNPPQISASVASGSTGGISNTKPNSNTGSPGNDGSNGASDGNTDLDTDTGSDTDSNTDSNAADGQDDAPDDN